MADEAKVTIRAIDKTKAAFQSAEGNVKKFRSAAVKLGAVLSVGVFATAIRSSLDFADSIDKAAKAAGLSTTFLQELRFAGDQVGITVTQIDEGFRRFTRRIGEFANSGAGPAAKALKALNIEILDSAGNVRRTEDIFGDLSVQFDKISSDSRKAALAAQLFGDDAGPKLRLLLAEGVGGIQRLRAEANSIGAVLDEDLIQNATEAKDKLSALTNVIKVQLTAALIEMAPLITAAAAGILRLSKAIVGTFDTGPKTQIEAIDLAIASLIKRIDESERARSAGRLSSEETAAALRNEINLQTQLTNISKARITMLKQGQGQTSATQRELPAPSLVTDADDAAARKRETEAEKEFEQAVKNSEDAVKAANQEYVEWQTSLDKTAQSLREQLNPIEALETKLVSIDELLTQGKIGWDTYADAVFAALDETDKRFADMEDSTKEASDAAIDLGFAFQSSFENAVLEGEKLSDVLDGLLQDIAKVVLRQTITQPLGNAISGGISGLFPAFASGTSFAPGGLSIVGESGPELVNLPRGSQVFPNGSKLGGGGTTVNVVNNTNQEATVQRSNDGSGRELINIVIGEVARNIVNGGAIDKTMRGKYGLRNQPIGRS